MSIDLSQVTPDEASASGGSDQPVPQHPLRHDGKGRFPKPVDLGPNRVAWRERDVVAFLEQCGRKRGIRR